MPAGLIIYNDSGTIQVDETWKNLVMLNKGSVTTVSPGAEDFLSRFSLTITGTAPLLAIASPYMSCIVKCVQNGSQFTYIGYTKAPVGTNISYYIFDTQPNVAPGTAGFVVRNGSNQVTFSSVSKPLRITAIIEQNVDMEGGSTQDHYLPTGRVYAIIQGLIAYEVRTAAVGPSIFLVRHLVGTQAIAGNKLSVSAGMFYSSQSSGFGGHGQSNCTILAVDVTGF